MYATSERTDLRGAVAVVHIDVHHRHAPQPPPQPRVDHADGDVVEQAEALRAAAVGAAVAAHVVACGRAQP